jgi:hypothetical protein
MLSKVKAFSIVVNFGPTRISRMFGDEVTLHDGRTYQSKGDGAVQTTGTPYSKHLPQLE